MKTQVFIYPIVMLALVAILLGVGCRGREPTPTSPPVSVMQPVVTINSPANGARVHVGQEFQVNVTATDPRGIFAITFAVDGEQAASLPSTPPQTTFSATQPLTLRTKGPHTITVVATNTAGVPSAPVMINLVAEAVTAPTVVSRSPVPATKPPPTTTPGTPTDAAAFFLKGTADFIKGDYDYAISNFDQAIQLKPDYVEAYYSRGVCYFNKRDFTRALADFDQAIKLKPDLYQAYVERGNTYDELGDFNRAMTDYNKAISLKPDYFLVYYDRGVVLMKRGYVDQAIGDWSEAIRLSPNHVPSYYNRALAYKTKGDKDKAIADYKKVVELSTDPALRQKAQEQLALLGAPLAPVTVQPPAAPTNCKATQIDTRTIRVEWQFTGQADGFRIYQGKTALEATVNASARSWTIADLPGGVQHHFDVRAYNTAGESRADACSVDVTRR